MDQGIGRVVVTCNALLIWRICVKSNSIPVCRATLNKMLIRLTPITKYHGGVPPFLLLRPPPDRVGKAASP